MKRSRSSQVVYKQILLIFEPNLAGIDHDFRPIDVWYRQNHCILNF